MTEEDILQKYPYKYETHMHTCEGSACGLSSGHDMALSYKKNGYTGIIVTDHNWGGNTAIDRALPWKEWVEHFFAGYRAAKQCGDEIGLQVFPGYEAGYGGPEFLIYGIEPEVMAEHPELWTASVEEQYRIVHSLGGMVIQAHPFREAYYIKQIELYPQYVDGIEIINACHSNPADGSRDKVIYDVKAIALAKQYGLPATAGSDQHSVKLLGGGGAFPTPLSSIKDFQTRIRKGEDYVLTNGRQWFAKDGKILLTKQR